MYGTLALPHRALGDLVDAAGERTIDELRALARPIEGLRVLNLSLTGFGTGTAELLSSSVPLLNDLGLDCHWQVARESEETHDVNRAMYQALGGIPVQWTRDMTDAWLRYASVNAELLTEPFDVIIVHDPQPAAMRSLVPEGADGAKWLYHSHLDLTSAQEDVWLLLRQHLEKYDTAIFDAESFVRHDMPLSTHIIPPAIDPTSARNMPLPDDLLRTVLERYGIDPEKPLVVQASPCDPSSDMVGAVDCGCSLKERIPDLQLLLVIMTEPRDPQGRAYYDELARKCADHSWVTIVPMGRDVGNVELNVFQSAADVVMQRGLRKGYGMWVSDALWKRRPVVTGGAPGLREQVIDGETGIVAQVPSDFEDAVVRLLDDPALGKRLGDGGHDLVKRKFLITRYLRDELRVLNELHGSA